jgi:hypothetical protein
MENNTFNQIVMHDAAKRQAWPDEPPATLLHASPRTNNIHPGEVLHRLVQGFLPPNHPGLSGWITPELHRDNPHFIGAKINFLVQTYIVSKTYLNRVANAFYG